MSLREKHEFQFTGDKIANAANLEADYHKERAIYWKDEYKIAVAKAKEAGVEIQEYPVTGGYHAQMVLNPSLQARLQECFNKVKSHQDAADKFQIEAAAYGTQSDRVYELDAADVVYFRLAGSQRPE